MPLSAENAACGRPPSRADGPARGGGQVGLHRFPADLQMPIRKNHTLSRDRHSFSKMRDPQACHGALDQRFARRAVMSRRNPRVTMGAGCRKHQFRRYRETLAIRCNWGCGDVMKMATATLHCTAAGLDFAHAVWKQATANSDLGWSRSDASEVIPACSPHESHDLGEAHDYWLHERDSRTGVVSVIQHSLATAIVDSSGGGLPILSAQGDKRPRMEDDGRCNQRTRVRLAAEDGGTPVVQWRVFMGGVLALSVLCSLLREMDVKAAMVTMAFSRRSAGVVCIVCG